MTMNLEIRKIIPLGLAIAGIWVVGVALGYISKLSVGPLIVALFLVAFGTFAGAFRIGAGIRMSITAALVTTYFAFFASLATSERGRAKIEAEVGQQLWNNFTYLVGGVILFYFGASAASEIKHVSGASNANPSRVDATVTTDRPAG